MSAIWHDQSGNKFRKGNPGGPGRRRVADEERYLSVLRRTISEQDWAEIIAKARDQAKRGDATARAFLASYLIGKPTEYVNLDATSDGQALVGLMAQVSGTLPADETDMAPGAG